jgi:hypothetical protein
MADTMPAAMQDYVRAARHHAASRSETVLKLAGDLLVYRSARAALAGPALTDWTERYERLVRQLVTHAVDGLNDVFDTGAWPDVVDRLAEGPRSARADDLVETVQASIGRRFGDEAAATFRTGAGFLSGATIATARSRDGVRITVSRQGQPPLTLDLTPHREAGDQPRVRGAALLTGRTPLVIWRPGGIRRRAVGGGTNLGAVDLYGAAVGSCADLLAQTRREVRTTRRFGRVRVEGEAPIVVAVIWLVAVLVLWGSYELACTGDVIEGNAGNQDSDACKVLAAISVLVSIGLGIYLGFGVFGGGKSGQGSGGTGSGSYNLNPPQGT